MNMVCRTNIKVDVGSLFADYQEIVRQNEEIHVSINDGASAEKYKNYCFPGSNAHGRRIQDTELLTKEQERAFSNTSDPENDYLFTKRNKLCVGYINKVLDFFTDGRRCSYWTLEPGFSYKPHTDYPLDTFRAHIPLITNPFCHMAYSNGESYHMPADGHVWLARSDIKHTAWNMGAIARTHVMFKVPIDSWSHYANHRQYTI